MMPGTGREAAQLSQPGPAGPAAHSPGGPPGTAGRWRAWLPGLACAAVPALAAAAVTGYGLGSLSLWRDEAYSIEVARRPVSQIVTLLGHTDAVNGAYYLVLHVVIAALGTSAAAVRLPSVLAMAVAAGMTAVTGRRLARLAALPAPALTGAIAGLAVAAAPMATWYAQEARSYAIVAMLATIAIYLLVRALGDPRWRWWAAYGLAVALAGAFNLLALLLVAAHAATVAAAWARRHAAPPPGVPAQQPRPWRWLGAVAAAGAVLSPLLVTGYSQRGQISWLGKPGLHDAVNLAISFAGSRLLLVPVGVVALAGLAAGVAGRPAAQLPPAAVALPWLVLPPAILLAVSQISPAYDARYVLYCLPALALLVAAGLAWLAQLAARTPLATALGGAWLPSLVAGVALAALLVTPQEHVRLPASRPDNLRAASAILAAHERPGDAVFYLPSNMRVMSMGYPAPWRRLRDVALAQSPVAAANLIGADVATRVLAKRFADVSRVWVVTGDASHRIPAPATPIGKEEMALITGWRLAGQWSANMVGLRLYQRP